MVVITAPSRGRRVHHSGHCGVPVAHPGLVVPHRGHNGGAAASVGEAEAALRERLPGTAGHRINPWRLQVEIVLRPENRDSLHESHCT